MVKTVWKKYIWLIGSVVVTTLVIFLSVPFVFIPTVRSIGTADKELAALTTDKATLTDKLAQLQSLKEKEEELKEDAAIVTKALPTKKEVGDLFIQLDGIAAASGSVMKSISGSDEETITAEGTSEVAIGGVETANYSLEVAFSNYSGFKTFLAKSEKALRFITLDNFNITGVEENSLTVNLKYKAYYRTQE